jgi:hypothetical protein
MRFLAVISLLIVLYVTASLAATYGDFTYEVISLGGGGSAPNETYVQITQYNGSQEIVTIPEYIEGLPVCSIGSRAFSPWDRNLPLTTINFPNTIKIIGDHAFYRTCPKLVNVTIPSQVNFIGDGAFSECASLENINVDNNNQNFLSENGVLFNKNKTILHQFPAGKSGAYNIPVGVTTLPWDAFLSSEKLTEVTMPTTVTYIGPSCFNHCSSLQKINIPRSVTAINDTTFAGCISLNSIELPDTITSLGSFSFIGCRSLSEIIVPASVTSVGGYAFSQCSNLMNVTFLGDKPTAQPVWGNETEVFDSSPNVTVYFSGTSNGWSALFCGRPATLSGTVPISLSIIYNSINCNVYKTPNRTYFLPNENVAVTVTPNAGYRFLSWIGDLNSSSSAIDIVMNSSKTITANVVQDNQDIDGDGLTNYQESVVYNTNPNLKDSNGDGVEDGQAVSMGFSPTINFSALIAHPPTGLYTANQIQNMAMGDLVLNKNVNGTFTLNYDIEQSTDLQNWTPYQAVSVPLNGLPTDKAFVRVKLKR